MDDRGPDNIDANYDPSMEATNTSPNMLSLQAATMMGICATVVIGNSLVCLLGNRKSRQSSCTNMVLLLVTVLNAFTALLAMPLMTASILETRWRYGDGLCRGTGTLTFVFIILAVLGVFIVLFNRSCSLMCYKHDKHTQNTKWLFFVLVFLIGSVLGLFVVVEWKALFNNPTRLLCRSANSPSRVGYRLFYGGFSVLLCIMVMILFAHPKREDKILSSSDYYPPR